MVRLSTIEAGRDLTATLEQVRHDGERVVLCEGDQELGALVSLEDLELLRQMEDRLDLEAVEAALAESDERIPYEDVRAELGLNRLGPLK